jgi:aspartate kinase
MDTQSLSRVFKFGGASVRDAERIRNVVSIIAAHQNEAPLIVVSAMGKVTNALESVLKAYLEPENGNAAALVEALHAEHLQIAKELVPENDPLWDHLENVFAELYWAIEETQPKSYDFEYDQIVSCGELISSRILEAALRNAGIPVHWVDARDLIQTDDNFREGLVDWELTQQRVQQHVAHYKQAHPNAIVVTQGFIGSTQENFNITLGREGSDYSAAILAYCLPAREVVIWKDVPGVLNADPRRFDDARLMPELSYYDAIELAYYGATVIHPKTLKPLQNKNIPLRVKSFLDPLAPGTRIGSDDYRSQTATFIVKSDQILLSISPRDFSFIIEEHIRDIFEQLAQCKVKVNLMQNSALKFSVCVSAEPQRLMALTDELQKRYTVRYNKGCELLTVRNFTHIDTSGEAMLNRQFPDAEILMESRSRTTLQRVYKTT